MKTEVSFVAEVKKSSSLYWHDDHLQSASFTSWSIMEPFEGDSGLFVELAYLPPTKEKILEFATEHGLIDDTIGGWKAAITEMKGYVEAWQKGKSPPTPLRLDDFPANISLIQLEDRVIVRIVLRSLHMLLKCQAALAITGGAKLQECVTCGRPFLLFPPFTRSTRVYCSAACKTAAYRKRQLESTSDVTPKKRKSSKKRPR